MSIPVFRGAVAMLAAILLAPAVSAGTIPSGTIPSGAVAEATAVAAPAIIGNDWSSPMYDSLGLDDPRAPVTISGRVVERNAAGVAGVADVCVSDGAQVVKTGADGAFVLGRVTPGWQRFVFVVTPTGFRIGGDFWRRIPVETGDMRVEFALERDPASLRRDHAFAHITDTHGMGGDTLARLDPERVPFGIITGDLVNNAAATAEFVAFRKKLESVRIPLLMAPGNHDTYASGGGGLVTRAHPAHKSVAAGESPAEGDANPPEAQAGEPRIYEDFFGPSYYAFNYGGRHYVVLNSMAERDRQRTWLSRNLATLAKGTEILVFQHYPLTPDEVAFLRGYPIRAVFFGHTHADLIGMKDGILCVSTVGLGHSRDLSPLTVRIATFTGKDFTFANMAPGLVDQAALPPLPPVEKGAPPIRTGSDWTHFKADPARTGATPDRVGAPLVVAWTRALGGGYAYRLARAHGGDAVCRAWRQGKPRRHRRVCAGRGDGQAALAAAQRPFPESGG